LPNSVAHTLRKKPPFSSEKEDFEAATIFSPPQGPPFFLVCVRAVSFSPLPPPGDSPPFLPPGDAFAFVHPQESTPLFFCRCLGNFLFPPPRSPPLTSEERCFSWCPIFLFPLPVSTPPRFFCFFPVGRRGWNPEAEGWVLQSFFLLTPFPGGCSPLKVSPHSVIPFFFFPARKSTFCLLFVRFFSPPTGLLLQGTPPPPSLLGRQFGQAGSFFFFPFFFNVHYGTPFWNPSPPPLRSFSLFCRLEQRFTPFFVARELPFFFPRLCFFVTPRLSPLRIDDVAVSAGNPRRANSVLMDLPVSLSARRGTFPLARRGVEAFFCHSECGMPGLKVFFPPGLFVTGFPLLIVKIVCFNPPPGESYRQ